MSEFTMEISRPGEFGALTSATLELPAAWAEYKDAIQKARINDNKPVYFDKILHCKHDWLGHHIPANGNLLELNLPATRIKVIERDNAADTSYGILRRYDGGPIQASEQNADPGMKMEGP